MSDSQSQQILTWKQCFCALNNMATLLFFIPYGVTTTTRLIAALFTILSIKKYKR